jgi:hypothetical protein
MSIEVSHRWLSYNQLTGTIPQEIENLNKLELLWVCCVTTLHMALCWYDIAVLSQRPVVQSAANARRPL